MICPRCGHEYAGNFCPQCGSAAESRNGYPPPLATGRKKKKHGTLNIVFIVIAVLLFLALFGSLSSEGEPAAAPAAQPKPAPPIKNTVYGIGQTAVVDGVSVTWTGVSMSSGNQYFSPAAGNVFVYCEFLIENNSPSDLHISTLISFNTYFDDYLADLSIHGLAVKSDIPQLDGTVISGKKFRGIVAYEAPRDWKAIEINVSPDMFGEKLTFRGELKTQA